MANANRGRGVVSSQRIANDIDRHVGARLRERRCMLGLTQEEMAALIGVTYPQLCKYERAINRVSSGRLHEIAMAMDVDVTYFFQDMDHLESYGLIGSPSLHPDAIELSQHFLDMPHGHRKALRVIARALAGVRSGGEDSPLELIPPAVLAEVA